MILSIIEGEAPAALLLGGATRVPVIAKKRKALGLEKARERVLYDMAMRRALA